MDIEWVEFVVFAGMVDVEMDKIVVQMENIVDMVDMMFEYYREVGFHKRIISNLGEKFVFEPTKEAMLAKEKGHSMCFVQNLDKNMKEISQQDLEA